MEQIEPYASRAPYLIAIGNHEYDYDTAHKEKHKKATEPDPSGRKDPYRPDWGNYGAHSDLAFSFETYRLKCGGNHMKTVQCASASLPESREDIEPRLRVFEKPILVCCEQATTAEGSVGWQCLSSS